MASSLEHALHLNFVGDIVTTPKKGSYLITTCFGVNFYVDGSSYKDICAKSGCLIPAWTIPERKKATDPYQLEVDVVEIPWKFTYTVFMSETTVDCVLRIHFMTVPANKRIKYDEPQRLFRNSLGDAEVTASGEQLSKITNADLSFCLCFVFPFLSLILTLTLALALTPTILKLFPLLRL